MARMYSRKRGKSGPTHPSKKAVPSWVDRSDKEIESLVTKLRKEGKTNSQIGLIMRDIYGVPDVKAVTNKKIGKILKEKNMEPEIPEDLMALIKKIVKLKKHMGENKHDMPANRGVQLTESKIRRLIKYYKKVKKLPIEWKYDEKRIRLIV